jgi:hypothetical protein
MSFGSGGAGDMVVVASAGAIDRLLVLWMFRSMVRVVLGEGFVIFNRRLPILPRR